MTIAIGCDHAGIELKNELVQLMCEMEIDIKDFGCAVGEKADYPVKACEVAKAVASGEFEKGVLICGTGVGMSTAANKVKGIRAAVCSEPYSAEMSIRHNNANILCMGQRVVGSELAKMILRTWLAAEFEGGRHAARVDLITDIEN